MHLLKTIFLLGATLTTVFSSFYVLFAADGGLGVNSTASSDVSLAITQTELNRVSSEVANRLQSTRQTNFPVCFMFIDSPYVNVNVVDLQEEGFAFNRTGENAIPYAISLGESAGELKVRANTGPACMEESALKVNISLLPAESDPEPVAIHGKLHFLIKS